MEDKMSEQFQQKIMEYIDSIAHGLGVASQFVLETLVKQKIIEGWVYTLICLILFAALVFALFKLIPWLWKMADNDMETFFLSMLIPILVTIILIIIICVVLPESIMKIFNPQYYALKDILDAVKGH
jgi:biotin transporter BioY